MLVLSWRLILCNRLASISTAHWAGILMLLVTAKLNSLACLERGSCFSVSCFPCNICIFSDPWREDGRVETCHACTRSPFPRYPLRAGMETLRPAGGHRDTDPSYGKIGRVHVGRKRKVTKRSMWSPVLDGCSRRFGDQGPKHRGWGSGWEWRVRGWKRGWMITPILPSLTLADPQGEQSWVIWFQRVDCIYYWYIELYILS